MSGEHDTAPTLDHDGYDSDGIYRGYQPMPEPIASARCRVVRPPVTDACGAVANSRVFFPDGDVTPACQDCALYLQQIAGSHGTMLKVERL